MKKIFLSVLVIALTACSAFKPTFQEVRVTCNVPETILKINGDTLPCPTVAKLRRDSKVSIEAYKDGYDRYSKQIDYHLSTAAKWDIVGTCLVFYPIIGLAFPGAWDLDQTDINVMLNKYHN